MRYLCLISNFLPVISFLLTILGDKSNAAVEDDRDAVFGQLLVTEALTICTGSLRDGRVPQSKVHPVEAVDVDGSVRKRRRNEGNNQ